MKPLLDDTHWDDMVARTILSPEFAEAWKALKGSGIGSMETTGRIADLIRNSDWHLSRLKDQHATIMEACALSSDTEFDHRVMDELLIAATAFLTMGIMLGVTLTVRRLAKDVLEALEEEREEGKPLVN